MSINATLDLCDDIRFEVGGKLTVVGLFSKNVSIDPELPIQKLICLFHIEGLVVNLPRTLVVEVTFPQSKPRQQNILIPKHYLESDNRKWLLRGVILIEDEMLFPGEIEARVVVDGIGYDVGAGQIVVNPK